MQHSVLDRPPSNYKSHEQILIAILKFLIANNQNSKREHIKIDRDKFDKSRKAQWMHPWAPGYMIHVYKTRALLNDSELVAQLVRQFNNTQLARADLEMKAFAPKGCYFMDEASTKDRVKDWTDYSLWIALV